MRTIHSIELDASPSHQPNTHHATPYDIEGLPSVEEKAESTDRLDREFENPRDPPTVQRRPVSARRPATSRDAISLPTSMAYAYSSTDETPEAPPIPYSTPKSASLHTPSHRQSYHQASSAPIPHDPPPRRRCSETGSTRLRKPDRRTTVSVPRSNDQHDQSDHYNQQARRSSLRSTIKRIFGRRSLKDNISLPTSVNVQHYTAEDMLNERHQTHSSAPRRDTVHCIRTRTSGLSSHPPINSHHPSDEKQYIPDGRPTSRTRSASEPSAMASREDLLDTIVTSAHHNPSPPPGPDTDPQNIGFAVTKGSHPQRRSRSVGDFREPDSELPTPTATAWLRQNPKAKSANVDSASVRSVHAELEMAELADMRADMPRRSGSFDFGIDAGLDSIPRAGVGHRGRAMGDVHANADHSNNSHGSRVLSLDRPVNVSTEGVGVEHPNSVNTGSSTNANRPTTIHTDDRLNAKHSPDFYTASPMVVKHAAYIRVDEMANLSQRSNVYHGDRHAVDHRSGETDPLSDSRGIVASQYRATGSNSELPHQRAGAMSLENDPAADCNPIRSALSDDYTTDEKHSAVSKPDQPAVLLNLTERHAHIPDSSDYPVMLIPGTGKAEEKVNMEERILTLEIKIINLEYSLSRLQSHILSPPSDTSTATGAGLSRSRSHSQTRTPSLVPSLSPSHSRLTASLSRQSQLQFQSHGKLYADQTNAHLSKNNSFVDAHKVAASDPPSQEYAALLALIQDERAARFKLEEQLAQLSALQHNTGQPYALYPLPVPLPMSFPTSTAEPTRGDDEAILSALPESTYPPMKVQRASQAAQAESHTLAMSHSQAHMQKYLPHAQAYPPSLVDQGTQVYGIRYLPIRTPTFNPVHSKDRTSANDDSEKRSGPGKNNSYEANPRPRNQAAQRYSNGTCDTAIRASVGLGRVAPSFPSGFADPLSRASEQIHEDGHHTQPATDMNTRSSIERSAYARSQPPPSYGYNASKPTANDQGRVIAYDNEANGLHSSVRHRSEMNGDILSWIQGRGVHHGNGDRAILPDDADTDTDTDACSFMTPLDRFDVGGSGRDTALSGRGGGWDDESDDADDEPDGIKTAPEGKAF